MFFFHYYFLILDSTTADTQVSSPLSSPSDVFLPDQLPSDASAFSFCSSFQPCSLSALSPDLSESRTRLSPRLKGINKESEPRDFKRSQSTECNIDSTSTRKPRENIHTQTKNKSHNSKDSSRHRKSSKQQPSLSEDPRKSNQEGQVAVIETQNDPEENQPKRKSRNSEKRDSNERVERKSRESQRNNKREGAETTERKRRGEGVDRGVGSEEEKEMKSTLRRKKEPQGKGQDRDTSISREKKSSGHHKHEEERLHQRNSKDLQRNSKRKNEVEKRERQTCYTKVHLNEGLKESEEDASESLTMSSALGALTLNTDDQTGAALWKVPSSARILTREEVMRDFYG